MGHLLLLWRHRHITNAAGWEIPAGWAEPREDLAAAAIREVMEETGFLPDGLRPILEYHPLSGISTMRYTVFLGTQPGRMSEPEITETDRIEWFAPQDVRKMLTEGLVLDGPSLTALSYYLATANDL